MTVPWKAVGPRRASGQSSTWLNPSAFFCICVILSSEGFFKVVAVQFAQLWVEFDHRFNEVENLLKIEVIEHRHRELGLHYVCHTLRRDINFLREVRVEVDSNFLGLPGCKSLQFGGVERQVKDLNPFGGGAGLALDAQMHATGHGIRGLDATIVLLDLFEFLPGSGAEHAGALMLPERVFIDQIARDDPVDLIMGYLRGPLRVITFQFAGAASGIARIEVQYLPLQ